MRLHLLLLQSLLDEEFVPHHWSVKRVIKRLLSSSLFAAKNYSDSADEAYRLPMAGSPWTQQDLRGHHLSEAAVDPSVPANRPLYSNSPGDHVTRFAPDTLLQSASRALLQPSRPFFPSTTLEGPYNALGVRLDSTRPGSTSFSLQGLLVWEDLLGSCNATGGDDYVHRLTEAAAAQGRTRKDAVLALKDRLLSDPAIGSAAEEAELTALLGALSAPATADLEPALRQACAAMLTSPQFTLAGMQPQPATTTGFRYLPKTEPQSYAQECAKHSGTRGYDNVRWVFVGCATEPLTGSQWGVTRFELPEVCPYDSCRVRLLPDPEELVVNPEWAFRTPPPVDVRAGGHSLPPEQGVFLWWGDGAEVKLAEGVQVLPATDKEASELIPEKVPGYDSALAGKAGQRMELTFEATDLATGARGSTRVDVVVTSP